MKYKTTIEGEEFSSVFRFHARAYRIRADGKPTWAYAKAHDRDRLMKRISNEEENPFTTEIKLYDLLTGEVRVFKPTAKEP